MHILFLTQVLPYPLDAGPKVRAYYVLRHLAETHQVTLLSFVRSTDTDEALAHLSSFCDGVHVVPMKRGRFLDGMHLLRSVVMGKPFIIQRDWVRAMVKRIDEVLASDGPFDAVHADQLWMAPYALMAQQQGEPANNMSAVLDQHNAVYLIPQRLAIGESNSFKRLLLERESRKLAHFEVDVCSKFDHVVWVTQEDYQAVQSESTGTNSVPNSGVIPICVDPLSTPMLERKPNAMRVTFLGGLHYPPNAEGICWFAEHVFPSVLQRCPGAVLTVIGKQPPPRLSNLGIPDGNLEVTGYVTDPDPFLAETATFVVPLHAGGGMRVKILDAWSWGLPVVSTTVGAEGIQYRDGKDIRIADSPSDFAAAVCDLIESGEASRRMAESARGWVSEHYDWRTTYQCWNSIYSVNQVRQVQIA